MTKKDTTNTLNRLGALIAELRRQQGLTQKEFAQKLKTTQSVIARIEQGEQNLSTAMIGRIGEIFKRDIVSVSEGSLTLKVSGGKKLSGKIATKTSKNAAVALLCASLLNKGTTILRDVAKIEEVYRLIEVLESLKVKITWNNGDLIIEPPKKISLATLNKASAKRTRSIILFLGPLLHHLKKFSLPQAGGCKLGSRTVRPHFFALENFGVTINTTPSAYKVSHKALKSSEFALYESGDTVTENALMAAALIPGKTTIRFASANYQVQDLCFFLEKCGVKIEGVGTTTLVVHGVKEINKEVEYHISPDPIDAMFFISAGIITKSAITITRAPIDFLELELLKLEKMGLNYSISKRYKAKNGVTDLVDISLKPSNLVALEEKIEARPYPGLNIDNLPFFVIIATQAKGTTLIHDWVYEKRALHNREIERLGANVLLADPHRLYITGPTTLKSAEVVCPPALRPSAIILLGMLAAKGDSTLRNIYSINRGYEDIVKRLNKLGAKVEQYTQF
jgi:UDP-N-acetylglucosamine 1-carboxyvinyltransferase